MTEKEMSDLCRVVEELQKTDTIKANDWTSQTERLKVLC